MSTHHARLVSVVVPAYNAEATIDQTLQSVRSQSYPHLEVIVVDDGSTDGTRGIVLSHAAQDRRIRLVWEPNSGVAAARNHGIRVARGDLIAPVDADDLWSPEKVARQVDVFDREGHGVTLVYTLAQCGVSRGSRRAAGGRTSRLTRRGRRQRVAADLSQLPVHTTPGGTRSGSRRALTPKLDQKYTCVLILKSRPSMMPCGTCHAA